MQGKSKGNPNWIKGVSGNPKGRVAKVDATPVVPNRLANRLASRLDAWINHATGLGVVGRDKAQATGFQLDLVGPEEALDLWRGDPIAARLVETVPNECLREGYELCIGDQDPPDTYKPPEQPVAPQPQATKQDHSAYSRTIRKAIAQGRTDAGEAKPLQEAVEKQLRDLNLMAALKECLCYERAGGGAALLIGANDFTTDLRQPLDLKKVRSLSYLTPLEAREIVPLYYYNDPMQPKFGQAAIYQLIPYVIGQSVDGTYVPRVTQIHESRLIIFPGVRCTRRITQNTMRGWGDSIFVRVNRALRAFNVGHQSAETLLTDFAQAVYKIKGLAKLLARDPQGGLISAMVGLDMSRSLVRAAVIDSEEDFERKATPMTGFPETLDRLALNLAAAADMPMTLLMGQSPAGLNATGASDIRFFYDRISSTQTLRIGPMILRIVEILLACMGEDPDTTNHSIKFKALWQPTEKEVADAHFSQAQSDAIYLANSVVSPEEIALSRFGGDQYSYETRVDFEARASMEAVVAPAIDADPEPDPVMYPTAPMPASATKPTTTPTTPTE